MRPSYGSPRLRKMIRSGLRRYPKHLVRSVLEAPGPDWTRIPHEPHRIFTRPTPFTATWLGHATVLLHVADRWILTDPVFSERIGPRVGNRTIGISRQTPLPLHPRELPPIDVILISHAHFDHLDRPSLRVLASRRTTVVTATRTGPLIPGGFGEVVELRQDEAWRDNGLRITAIQPAHWGSRMALDRWRGCNAYLLESDDGRVLYAGDTAETRAFDRLGGVDLAIFGIGAYEPWEHAHATPEQVWRMTERMGVERLLPVHHSTFELSDEPAHEPMARLLRIAGGEGVRVIDPAPGELWTPQRG